jgi:Pentapeptide repeats (8 copies)
MASTASSHSYRGRSFRGKDLHGTRLGQADLRGADFTNADLRGADLSEVRTGRSLAWTTLLGLAALVMSAALGAIAGWSADYVRGLLSDPDPRYRIASGISIVEFVALLIVLVWKGFGPAMRNVAGVTTLAAISSAIIAILLGAGSGAAAARIAILVGLGAALVTLGVLVRAAAGTIHAWVFYLVAVVGGLATRGTGGGIVVMALAIVSVIVSKRALGGDPRSGVLSRWAHELLSLGGTRFRGADLREASFRAARLRNSDFRGARLDPRELDRAVEVEMCSFDPEPGPPEPGSPPSPDANRPHERI